MPEEPAYVSMALRALAEISDTPVVVFGRSVVRPARTQKGPTTKDDKSTEETDKVITTNDDKRYCQRESSLSRARRTTERPKTTTGVSPPTLEERDRALPAALKPSYCPGCHGRAVVVASAVDHLRCAGCMPLTPIRRRLERVAP